ncbi:hypothetical protein YC2023_078287 [Brassica napus]
MGRVECAALFARGVYKPQFSLKVVWKKDTKLDEAIEQDKRYNLCAHVVKEVLNEPRQVILLRYLEKRRERLRLNFKAKSFVVMNPSLFEIYHDRIKPKSEPVHAEKLVHVKRDFGFRNDFLVRLVKKYPNYFWLTGLAEEGGKSFLELVDWKEETVRTEGDYISPYEDVSRLDQASREMEKRTVGVFHELLSLSLLKRVPVPTWQVLRRAQVFERVFECFHEAFGDILLVVEGRD